MRRLCQQCRALLGDSRLLQQGECLCLLMQAIPLTSCVSVRLYLLQEQLARERLSILMTRWLRVHQTEVMYEETQRCSTWEL